MSGSTLPVGADQPVDAIASTLTILAFNDDASQPASARLADWILCYWNLSNLTPQVRTLTFAKGVFFKVRLLGDQNAVIWESTDPQPGDDAVVSVQPGDTYSIPPETGDLNSGDNVPRVELKAILSRQNVAPEVDVTVEFLPLAKELGVKHSMRLWR